jgi:hypothetical protein
VRAAVRACARSRRDLCVQMDQLLVVIAPRYPTWVGQV